MTHAELLAAARKQLEGMTSGPVPEWVWNISLPSLDLLKAVGDVHKYEPGWGVCKRKMADGANCQYGLIHIIHSDAAAAYVAALRKAVE